MGKTVLKFGGSSVSSGENFLNVADIIMRHWLNGEQVNVTVSGMGVAPGTDGTKFTDTTLKLCEDITKGNDYSIDDYMGYVKGIHNDVISYVNSHLKGSYVEHLIDTRLLDTEFSELESLLRAGSEDISEGQFNDSIVSFGEILSTKLLAAVTDKVMEERYNWLKAVHEAGHSRTSEWDNMLEVFQAYNKGYTQVVNSDELGFVTDSDFERAKILDRSFDQISEKDQNLRRQNDRNIIFTQGFVARDENGTRTTIGRDGSNVTAVAWADAVKADNLYIYSDTNGVLRANPKYLDETQTVRHISYLESGLQTDLGGMPVIKQPSLDILTDRQSKLNILIKNAFNTSDPGTLITPEPHTHRYGVKCVGIKDAGSGNDTISLIGENISQMAEDHTRIKNSVRAVLGTDPDYRISQDYVQFDVPKDRTHEVINSVNNHLKRINIILYGAGDIGTSVLERIKGEYDTIGMNVVGIVDSKGALGKIGGFSEGDLETIIQAKRSSKHLGEVSIENAKYISPKARRYQWRKEVNTLNQLQDMEKGKFLLVDATNGDDMFHRYGNALHLGMDIVTANKKPMAADLDPIGRKVSRRNKNLRTFYNALFNDQVHVRATVGANLGIPNKLKDILATNPGYITGEGCVSGTNMYISSSLESGKSFSSAVRDAVNNGYAEPQPYDDLSGLDVLRKTTILWRMIATRYSLGFEQCDVKYGSFISKAVDIYNKSATEHLNVGDIANLKGTQFVDKMKLLDPAFAQIQAGVNNDHVLRYVGEIAYNPSDSRYKIVVGLKEVHKDSALGKLEDRDNTFIFSTDGGVEQYVVDVGPGAGVETTTDAVMSEIMTVTEYLRGQQSRTVVDTGEYKHPVKKKQPSGLKDPMYNNPFSMTSMIDRMWNSHDLGYVMRRKIKKLFL